jgi:hypothetical protein
VIGSNDIGTMSPNVIVSKIYESQSASNLSLRKKMLESKTNENNEKAIAILDLKNTELVA